jgi:hypothetical protein
MTILRQSISQFDPDRTYRSDGVESQSKSKCTAAGGELQADGVLLAHNWRACPAMNVSVFTQPGPGADIAEKRLQNH